MQFIGVIFLFPASGSSPVIGRSDSERSSGNPEGSFESRGIVFTNCVVRGMNPALPSI